MKTSAFRPANLYGWLKPVLDSAPEGILVESNERVVYANERYARLLGYENPGQILGHPIGELIADSDAPRLLHFSRMRILGSAVPVAYDFAARTRSGSTLRLHASVSIAAFGSTPYITTFARSFYDSPTSAPDPAISGPHLDLSPREQEVMTLLLDGKRIKEIAEQLTISEKTIATHRARLLMKMGLSDNRGLFQYALRHRLVDWT